MMAGEFLIISILLYAFLYVIALAVAILVNYLIAKTVSGIVVRKGYTVKETHAFAMCFWLGMIGYIYVAALPDRKLQEQNRQILELLQAKQHEHTN